MVFKLQLHIRRRLPTLTAALIAILFGSVANGQGFEQGTGLKAANDLFARGQYYQSARFAFAALDGDGNRDAESYAALSQSLVRAGLYHTAAYFFIRTLQYEKTSATQRVLKDAEELLFYVGVDLLRNYLLRHTKEKDYDSKNRSAYLYALGKVSLLNGNYKNAIDHFAGISTKSSFWAYALQMRGTARAILGHNDLAIKDFDECESRAEGLLDGFDLGGDAFDDDWAAQQEAQAKDLRARCQAGRARTLYQMEKFEEGDRAYDQVPKASFVWTDTLFEHAWNSFARKEYNRTLGKLVSYRSPGLRFVFNPEMEVLKAQSFLALCLYPDANLAINEFNDRYSKVGVTVKNFLEKNDRNLYEFYREGKSALSTSFHTTTDFNRVLNRFVRSPYFVSLTKSEAAIEKEKSAVKKFEQSVSKGGEAAEKGFSGFVDLVLDWRLNSVRLIGGTFVKNSLLDHYATLITNIEKMQFIKLEMLSRFKDSLLGVERRYDGRMRGNRIPERRPDQYYWSFNGEFWNDEIGDYVFGLESECKS